MSDVPIKRSKNHKTARRFGCLMLRCLGDGGHQSRHFQVFKDVIFAQGDEADAVFYIKKGKVKVAVVSKQGKEAVVALLGEDEFVGEGWPKR